MKIKEFENGITYSFKNYSKIFFIGLIDVFYMFFDLQTHVYAKFIEVLGKSAFVVVRLPV